MTTAIPVILTRGLSALVDEADYTCVSQFEWYAHWNGYTYYAARGAGGNRVYLHRFILGAEKGVQVDHEDLDGLNCTRLNLRIATQSQNNANRRKQSGKASSRFKGVWARGTKWGAQIKHNRTQIRLGCFSLEEDAARAYDVKARELYGEFALCNFQEESLVPGAGLEPAASAV